MLISPKGDIFVANTGDSRGVLCKLATVINSSTTVAANNNIT